MIVSTKPHKLERLGAASLMQLLEKRRLHEWAFRRWMSLYATQFQGPVLAATGERVAKTHVRIAHDQSTYRPSPAVRSPLK